MTSAGDTDTKQVDVGAGEYAGLIASSVFAVEFFAGHALRHLADFVRRVAKEIPLTFSPFGISTVICGPLRHATANIILRREAMTLFHVNPARANASESLDDWLHTVNINSADLYDACKQVSKRDVVVISQRDSHGPVEVRVIKQCGATVTSTIDVREYTPVVYSLAEADTRPSFAPNVTMSVTIFNAALTAISKLRNGKLAIAIYESSLVLANTNGSGATSVAVIFSAAAPRGRRILPSAVRDAVGTAPNFVTILTAAVVTYLTKLDSLSSEAAVRFYADPHATIARIETPISHIGCLQLHLPSVLRKGFVLPF
jgi:hypothetical protein